jgi:hypothetical protein
LNILILAREVPGTQQPVLPACAAALGDRRAWRNATVMVGGALRKGKMAAPSDWRSIIRSKPWRRVPWIGVIS